MITRLIVVDDTGDKVSGTAITAAWWAQVQDMIDARWSRVVVGDPTAGQVNDLAFAEADVIFFATSAAVTLTGLTNPTPEKVGKPLRLINVGATVVYLAHNSAASAATNRLQNFATSGPTPLMPGGSATYVFSGVFGGAGSWYLTAHEQGPWVVHPLAANQFGAYPSGIWAPSLTTSSIRYRLSGRTLIMQVTLVDIQVTVQGTLGILYMPQGYQMVGQTQHWMRASDNGAVLSGHATARGDIQQIVCFSQTADIGWNIATASTFEGTFVLEVK